MGKIIDSVCDWMVKIANDNSHGYSQDSKKRWLSPDVDCSSFVILGWEIAGNIPVRSKYSASYTGDMRAAFVKAGFKAIKYQKSIPLLKGDVLLNEQHHVVLYLGDGTIVHASSSETGGKYGKEGDQNSREVCVRSLYTPTNYSWQYILRYPEESTGSENPYPMPTSTLSIGSRGPGVAWLQWELVEAGANIQIDQDFGKLTKQALMDFQKAVGIECDGICGPVSRQKLLENKTKVIGVTPEKPKNPYTRPTRVIKLNCKGDDVKYCQYLLNQKDNANLVIDGHFGKLSKQAAINFQKKAFPNQPNEHDGIIGNKTLKALES